MWYMYTNNFLKFRKYVRYGIWMMGIYLNSRVSCLYSYEYLGVSWLFTECKHNCFKYSIFEKQLLLKQLVY